ncbi:beta-lysine acetyltransferase [Paucidesulfovibrio gracilis DSM 16080]|uniref:Beta-lysine acetyltransferase n=1 Tax=Paucidesulfovibrio gracilis DSM 16080 TaxID=1121449 RepID=A0A1T4Y343_9BACT|nr:putative beta-lysine N-acetyltransferase [Paucidesulfovibrio gracilis]SKA96234.1 beta-lysine acetyltransferase [Paucidesulfovibrio gracilis DSM 16080]
MQPDVIARMGESLVQHGPLNGRAYLMHLAPQDCPRIISRLDRLAEDNGYTKIFAKVPASAKQDFEAAEYRVEACVPGFFNGNEDGLFMGRYFADWRRVAADAEILKDVIRTAKAKASQTSGRNPLPPGWELDRLGRQHTPDMAALYSAVFDSYPFPIHDPAYLRETMESHVRYYGAFQSGRLAALCSAEIDGENGCAEMTDFATLPDFRGQGLAAHLLGFMHGDLEQNNDALNLKTLFTIARAASYGMNITFARAGYEFAGTLPNNTQISGGLESMNVWHAPMGG